MKEYSLYIGIAAGVLTAISMIPQLVKVVKEKKAQDISLFMVIILLSGVAVWVVYGILKEDYPIIVTNAFSFAVNLVLLLLSIRYK